MAQPDFQLNDLQNALAKEKNTKQLSKISNNFYKRLRNYLEDLEEEIEDIGFPSNSREEMLQRQYRRAKNMASELFNRRAQKLLIAAVHKVGGGGKPDISKMAPLEKEFYRDQVSRLNELKEEIFFGGYKRPVEKKEEREQKKEGPEEQEKVSRKEEIEKKSPEKEKQKQRKSAEKDGNKKEKTEEKEISHDEEFQIEEVLIHIIEDVPTFVDLDTTYDLKKEDVVTLREDIANVLISREKARKIELG